MMTERRSRRRLRQVAGIAVLPLIFILPIVLVLLWRISAVHDTHAVEERTDSVISEMHLIHEGLFGMQSALRGYLLTGDPAFRLPFARQHSRVEAGLTAIQSEAAGHTALTAEVARLSPLVRAWLAYASEAMSRRYASTSRAHVSVDERLMEAITSNVSAILMINSTERGESITRGEASIRSVIIIVVLCAFLAAIATGLSVRRVLISTDIDQQAEREHTRLAEARHRTAELERENVRIRAADKFKSEYLATMSHELRTPLTAMLGFSEVIRDGMVGPITSEQAEALDHIIKGGHHLLELVGSVLDLAKVEAGKLDVAMVVADPRLPARDVIDGMRELAARKSIRLDVDLSFAPPRALIDPSRFRQILYNYLSNAIKFTPRGGAITVRILAEGSNGFRLDVTDNGIGIDAADVSTLFKEFRQVDLASSTEPGTGLGLALTKRLVEAQGGRVGVNSVRGAGSTFFAVFPDAVAAARAQREKVEAIVA